MKITDLFSLDDLTTAISEGYVRVRTHPADPTMGILNYTEKAQYERAWTDVTRQCRGLIYDSKTLHVLQRPFEKFFNYGEHPEGSLDMTMRATVTDKMDGSLGILYFDPQGYLAIATRGSFESEQALEGTKIFHELYEGRFYPLEGLTYLFEIVYPDNRIVLDYGNMRDLILLGTRDIEGGGYLPASEFAGGWPGSVAIPLEAHTLAEALALPPRPNAEGVVVQILDHRACDVMVKLKQEDYVRLHKLVTGLNERAVWEHLAEHGDAEALLASVPDEFHAWVIEVEMRLQDAHDELQGRAHAAYHETLAELNSVDDQWGRKDFANRVLEEHEDIAALLFQLLDGRDISPAIWKTLRPKGETASLLNRSEDNS